MNLQELKGKEPQELLKQADKLGIENPSSLRKQDLMFAGGGEELDWTLSCLFDAMGAMSSKYNDTPEKASRAFDADRDGFVIGGGGGMLASGSAEGAPGAPAGLGGAGWQ